jgi:hypothetical protein
MREAVGRVDNHLTLLPGVLQTFVWALPHQFRAPADSGAEVAVRIDDVGVWTLTARAGGRWVLDKDETLDGSATRYTVRASHAFKAPGTYFPALRVCSQRRGNIQWPHARVPNLGRVRVVVT